MPRRPWRLLQPPHVRAARTDRGRYNRAHDAAAGPAAPASSRRRRRDGAPRDHPRLRHRARRPLRPPHPRRPPDRAARSSSPRTGRRVLLLHHRKLDRWLQPGGHAEPGEADGEEVALREAREETGIAALRLHPDAPRPLDVDVHAIPARGSEPAHLHLDLRYVVIAPDERRALTVCERDQRAALVRVGRAGRPGARRRAPARAGQGPEVVRVGTDLAFAMNRTSTGGRREEAHRAAALAAVVAIGRLRAEAPARRRGGRALPRFGSDVDVVNLSVSVADTGRRYVTDLEQQDFTVLEDGVPQQVSVFDQQQAPVSVSILIDCSLSMQPSMAIVQGGGAAARPRPAAHRLRRRSSASTIATRWSRTSPPTRRLLEAGIRSIRPEGATGLYNAVYLSLRDLARRPADGRAAPARGGPAFGRGGHHVAPERRPGAGRGAAGGGDGLRGRPRDRGRNGGPTRRRRAARATS